MANDITAHTAKLLQQFSETLCRLNDLQNLECDNKHIEGAESAYMLRSYFLTKMDAEWEEIFLLFTREILPFVRDMKSGVRHG